MKTKTIYIKEYVELINFLTEERRRLGLLQKDVADALSISQADVSKIEGLDRRLDIYELKLLLKLYRVLDNPLLSQKVCMFFNGACDD